MQSMIAAALCADFFISTTRIGPTSPKTEKEFRAIQAEVIEPGVLEDHGRILAGGSFGFLAEFASALDAMRCAMRMQEAMRKRYPSVKRRKVPHLCIGISFGEILFDRDRLRYFHDQIRGDAVVEAALLNSEAGPGCILVSTSILDKVGDRLPYELEDLGERQFKHLSHPLRLFRILPNDQGKDDGHTT